MKEEKQFDESVFQPLSAWEIVRANRKIRDSDHLGSKIGTSKNYIRTEATKKRVETMRRKSAKRKCKKS